MIFQYFCLFLYIFRFFMSTLFNTSKIASACAGIFYLLTYVPYMIISILENGGVPVHHAIKVVFVSNANIFHNAQLEQNMNSMKTCNSVMFLVENVMELHGIHELSVGH